MAKAFLKVLGSSSHGSLNHLSFRDNVQTRGRVLSRLGRASGLVRRMNFSPFLSLSRTCRYKRIAKFCWSGLLHVLLTILHTRMHALPASLDRLQCAISSPIKAYVSIKYIKREDFPLQVVTELQLR